MPSTTGAWFVGAASKDVDWSTNWVVVGDVRPHMQSFDKLIITARCVTAPSTGNMTVKIQHSANYNTVETAAVAWETLIEFDSFQEGDSGKQYTEAVEDFHSVIRCVVKNSTASQEVVLDVYIREKQIGAD